jgi:hypothetical protein
MNTLVTVEKITPSDRRWDKQSLQASHPIGCFGGLRRILGLNVSEDGDGKRYVFRFAASKAAFNADYPV